MLSSYETESDEHEAEESDSESDESELLEEEDVEDQARVLEAPDRNPDMSDRSAATGTKPFDPKEMWYHLKHKDNPINKAILKVRRYKKLLKKWKKKVRLLREPVYVHICDEDSAFLNHEEEMQESIDSA